MLERKGDHVREKTENQPHRVDLAQKKAHACGGICARIHRKGRDAALAGGADQLLQRADPEQPGI